jgi:hypothetical protein
VRLAFGARFIGTHEANILVAFNETGAIFANGCKANDTTTFSQGIMDVLSTATVYGGEGTDTINVGMGGFTAASKETLIKLHSSPQGGLSLIHETAAGDGSASLPL